MELHQRYAESEGLRILAFPCNQFAKQEPGSDAVIKAFASKYGVEFDMYSKVDVNGSSAIPLYKFLKSRVRGSLGSFIKWNFEKFICDQNGIPVKRYLPPTQPLDLIPDLRVLFNSAVTSDLLNSSTRSS